MSIKSVLNSISPKLLTSLQFFYHFHKPLNWFRPKDLNEKINWLKYNSDTSLWTLCADKYRVREYIHEKGLDDTLVKLYGVWEKAEDGLLGKIEKKTQTRSLNQELIPKNYLRLFM